MTTAATSGPPPFANASAFPRGAQQVIPLSRVVPSATNPRKSFDQEQLEELAQSIRKHGLLQPILVRPYPQARELPRGYSCARDEAFEIVAGERRYRAASLARLETITALVRDLSDVEALEIQVVENLQRTDLDVLEEADGYRQLMATKKYDVQRIADRIGRSIKYVYDRVKLLSLTEEAQRLVRNGELTAGHAILLARLKPEDQKRAIGDRHDSPLFVEEHTLFRPDDEDLGGAEPRKAISVRELQAWIDENVKLEAAEADPMLFPDLVDTIQAATEENEKVVRITYEDITPEGAGGGPRPILGRSWKRADGLHGSKKCEHSVIGNVVIGAGRGEAFRVCVAKKKCAVHWSEYQKEAKARERAAGKESTKTGESQWEIAERKRKEQEARDAAARERWKKARPAVLKAIAAAVKKAPAGADSPLANLVLSGLDSYEATPAQAAPYVSRGRTAEDLLRHAAFIVIMSQASEWRGLEELPRVAKPFGVDVRALVDELAPPPKPDSKAKEKHPAAKKTKAPKKRKASRS